MLVKGNSLVFTQLLLESNHQHVLARKYGREDSRRFQISMSYQNSNEVCMNYKILYKYKLMQVLLNHSSGPPFFYILLPVGERMNKINK